ncbi:acid protease [Xylariaceae sp. FL1019]|nr:acid protease [Xylariaceae sp. FL1019]
MARPTTSHVLRHALAALCMGFAFGEAALIEDQKMHGVNATGINVNATNFFKSSGQVLTMPLKRVDHKGVATPSVAKRFFKADILGVYGAAYLAELTIGTSTNGNPQTVDVLIDTGSFELWVDPDCEASNVPEFCTAFGYYDPDLSSSSKKLPGAGFDIRYGSGDATGPYYTDDIYISGARIADQQFGVANSSDLVWFGIMGLGHGQGNGFIDYPIIIDSLADQGFTNTKLFSMDLGGQPAPGAAITGEMVFGGVDTSKYSGFLQRVPTDPSDPHYKVTVNSIGIKLPNSNISTPLVDTNIPLDVILDSGTTLSLLPESVVEDLAAMFPGAQPDGNGGYLVDCAFQDQDGSVDFEFLAGSSTVTINVAYKDFVWNSGGDCYLGAWYSDDLGIWILGDTFLRGAYVTFDQTNDAVFMGNYQTCTSGSLVAVPAGPNAAGEIQGACAVASSVPSTPSSSTPATLASSNSVSSTVILSAASSLGPSLNPVGPSASSSSSSGVPSSISSTSSSSASESSSSSSASSSVLITLSASISGIDPSSSDSVPGTNPSSSSSLSLTGTLPPLSTLITSTSSRRLATPATGTVPLNNPTDVPPGAPAQGGPDPDGIDGSNSIGDGAGPDVIASLDPVDPATATDGANGSGSGPGVGAAALTEITTTITTTISRAVIYTVTVCPDSVKDCPMRGQVATRFEEVVTEYCPGHETAPPNLITVYQGSPDATITEASGPAATTVVVVQPAQGGGEAVTVTEQQRPVTTIFEVTSCDTAENSCTTGMTTTRTMTIVETVGVEPVPDVTTVVKTASVEPVPDVTSAAQKPSIVPGNQVVYGLGNSTLSACGTACRGNAVAPTTEVQIGAASAFDGGLLDRRFLGAAFGFVWGIMFLL